MFASCLQVSRDMTVMADGKFVTFGMVETKREVQYGNFKVMDLMTVFRFEVVSQTREIFCFFLKCHVTY